MRRGELVDVSTLSAAKSLCAIYSKGESKHGDLIRGSPSYLAIMQAVLFRERSRSFSIEEHEIALRWIDLVKPSGYKIAVSLNGPGAEELLLIYLPKRKSPAFAIQRLRSAVLLIDVVGLMLPFPTLAAALLALSPSLKQGRPELHSGPRPVCITALPALFTDVEIKPWVALVDALLVVIKRAKTCIRACWAK